MILFHPTLRTNDSRYIKFVDWTTSWLWQWLCIIESAKHERLKDLETRAASESSRALNAKRFFCCCPGCGCLRAKRQFNNLEKMHTGMTELYVWVFFLPHLSKLLYLLGILHVYESRPIVALSSVLLGVWICCSNTSNRCSYSWQYVMLTMSVESFSKSFFQNALELY